MENASKALLIAAAVLVVIILVAVGMKIYSSTTGTGKVATSTGDTIKEKTGDATDLAVSEITGHMAATEKNIVREIKKAYQDFKNTGNIYESMQSKLRKLFNDNTLTVSNKGEKISVSLSANGEPKTYIYNIGEDSISEYVDSINYGGKTKATIQLGDIIEIGTEPFIIVSKSSAEIKALAINNIELKTDNPIQSYSAGTRNFSGKVYWTEATDEIDINNSWNYINNYIKAYKETLKNLEIEDITVKVPKRSELTADGVTKDMINNGKEYWTCSSPGGGNVYTVDNGTIRTRGNSDRNFAGVRPIIIIPK